MCESRLSNLAILSIERQLSKKIKFDTVIKDFAVLKVRKVQFQFFDNLLAKSTSTLVN